MRARRMHDESGFSLVELLVAMVLMGIVGVMLLGAVIQGNRSTARAQERSEAITDLQLVMERLSRELRAADPITLGQGAAVEMDIVRDGQTRHLRYALTGGALVETRGSGAAAPTTVLATQVTSFELDYLDITGQAISAPVAAADLGRIVRVQVHIERFIPAVGAPIEVETTVHLRNAS